MNLPKYIFFLNQSLTRLRIITKIPAVCLVDAMNIDSFWSGKKGKNKEYPWTFFGYLVPSWSAFSITFLAIDWSSSIGFEWNFSFYSTISTSYFVHFSWSTISKTHNTHLDLLLVFTQKNQKSLLLLPIIKFQHLKWIKINNKGKNYTIVKLAYNIKF